MASDINYASWPRHVGRHIDVGDQKQLFLDDGFLVERAEGIRYVMHQPVKHPAKPAARTRHALGIAGTTLRLRPVGRRRQNPQNVVHKPNLQIR